MSLLKCVKTGSLKMLNACTIQGAILLSWQVIVSLGSLPLQFPYPMTERTFLNRGSNMEDKTEDEDDKANRKQERMQKAEGKAS